MWPVIIEVGLVAANTDRRCPLPQMSVRSRHSRRRLPTNRSAWAMSWPPCPSPPSPARRPRSPRLQRRGPRARPQDSQGVSRTSTARSGPRRSPRSPRTTTSCSRSTTTPPSTGSNDARPTRSGSTFATVRLRTRVTKGPGSRAAGIAMAFKLIESAQARWRAVNAPHLIALVRAGAVFEMGKLIERPDESGGDQQVACHVDPQVLTIPPPSGYLETSLRSVSGHDGGSDGGRGACATS